MLNPTRGRGYCYQIVTFRERCDAAIGCAHMSRSWRRAIGAGGEDSEPSRCIAAAVRCLAGELFDGIDHRTRAGWMANDPDSGAANKAKRREFSDFYPELVEHLECFEDAVTEFYREAKDSYGPIYKRKNLWSAAGKMARTAREFHAAMVPYRFSYDGGNAELAWVYERNKGGRMYVLEVQYRYLGKLRGIEIGFHGMTRV